MTRPFRNGKLISSDSGDSFGMRSALFRKRASTANPIDLDEQSHAIKNDGDHLRWAPLGADRPDRGLEPM